MTISRRTQLITSLFGLGLIAICGTSAFGEEPADLRAVIARPEVQQGILSAAKRSAVVVNNPCPSARLSLVDKVRIYKPVTFDSSGRVSSGAWLMVVAQEGCGVSRLLNVAISVSGRGSLDAIPLLPGTTIADPVLQKDAMIYARLAAGKPEEDCNIGYIENTEFVQYEGAALEGAKGRPWLETWTLVSCTKKAIVQMHFAPHSRGTNIFYRSNETKSLELNAEKSVASAITSLSGPAAQELYRTTTKEMGLRTLDYTATEVERADRISVLRIPGFHKRSAAASRWMMCVYTDLAQKRGFEYWTVVYPEPPSEELVVGFPRSQDEDIARTLGPRFGTVNVVPTKPMSVQKMIPFCNRIKESQ